MPAPASFGQIKRNRQRRPSQLIQGETRNIFAFFATEVPDFTNELERSFIHIKLFKIKQHKSSLCGGVVWMSTIDRRPSLNNFGEAKIVCARWDSNPERKLRRLQ